MPCDDIHRLHHSNEHMLCTPPPSQICCPSREIETDAADGIGYVRTIKPYLLDLETTNGTSINKQKLEPARYYELLHTDVIKFGFSSRDYVMMNETAV